jgi:hypothetical protein
MTVTMYLAKNGRDSRILLDGKDITASVTEAHVIYDPEGLPEVALTLVASVELVADAALTLQKAEDRK